jgi:hypothetical protein
MQYKVILYNQSDSADVDKAGNFEFYTHDEAELCCTRWQSFTSSHSAFLWNGDVWRYFA